MNKKLFTQIQNEWRSNLWLMTELLLVSVVMWYIVDYMFVMVSIYREPRGFDISHCYLVTMGKLSDKSPDYVPYASNDEEEADIRELLERIRRRDDVEAVSLSSASYPYNQGYATIPLSFDTLRAPAQTIRRQVTPDFVRVFRYRGVHGETPEQLAELLKLGDILVSDNVFDNPTSPYGIRMSSLVGKRFHLYNDTTRSYRLGASLVPVRYSDYQQACDSYSMVYPLKWFDVHLELCLRVRPADDHGFIDRLRTDSEKLYRVGNIFIADIRSFADIRRNYQQAQTNEWRNYLFGMGFLMLNIFLGLLGTFWFRTQQRRGEIALMKSLGGTDRDIFTRQLAEGLWLLAIATVPAVLIDWNLANAELNAWMDDTTLAGGRFILTVLVSFVLVAFMMLAGIWIPARKAMKVHPAEALHDE